eukprot:TRINITY_DN5735_c0_g3_i1.p1 TRINITY_DN5735_c0_g3~~TRINITY_DN5735_c0_g3_i1.p1  ORF type:complete len:825 (-),score=123.40 TRINITY_DN5735_c0_g3_i1:145-2349(-)
MATGSHALQQELQKGGSADVDRVRDILATYGCAVASIRVSLKGLSKSSFEKDAVRWPLQIALLLGTPPDVGRVLLQAYPEIGRRPLVGSPNLSGCDTKTRHFLVQHFVLRIKEIFRCCSRQTLYTISQTKGWLQLGQEIVDVAPEVLTPRLEEILEAEMGGLPDVKIWTSPAVCGHSTRAKQIPIIFELFDMGRDALEICWPFFRHLICHVPEVLTPSLNGRTSLVAGIEAGAPPEMLLLMLDAAPDLADKCGSAGGAFRHLVKVHTNPCHSSTQYFSAPARDWERQRLLWLGHMRSTSTSSPRPPCPFGLLAETTIGRICAFLGRPSVAAHLFAAAPDVVSRADARWVVAAALCSIQRPLDISLLHQLLRKHPALAKERILVDELPCKISFSRGQPSNRWRCPPLHAVLMNRETRAPRLAARLIELDPEAAGVVDPMGQLPLVYVLRLQSPWCKVRALAELLLLHTPERKIGPSAPLAVAVRNGYSDGSDAWDASFSDNDEGVVAVPPLFVGLRNDSVPAEFLMQLVAKRPADLVAREIGTGASAVELGLRRADAGELVPQLLQAPGGEALALAPISRDAFLEVGRKSCLPAALALHLQSVPAALLPLLRASIHSLSRLGGASTAQSCACWKTSAGKAKNDERDGANVDLRRQSGFRCSDRNLGGDINTVTAKQLANELLGFESSVASSQTIGDVVETAEAEGRAWVEDLALAFDDYFDSDNSIASSSPRSFF